MGVGTFVLAPFIFVSKKVNMQHSVTLTPDPAHQKVYDVYEVFKNFFGEQYVDIQKDVRYSYYIIYVWWPHVTVTNEYNKSVNIQDLYAEIKVNLEGLIPYEFPGFLLNRATYSKEQFLSDYMHSHIRGIPKDNFSYFGTPCLGRGPIGSTITTLKIDYDIAEWMLFCQELSMYVTVESISGGPWRRMENIGSYTIADGYTDYNFSSDFLYPLFFTDSMRKEFIKYYLTNGHLSLSFRNGQFICGMPFYEYIIDLSNAFISYCNKTFHTENDIQKLRNSSILQSLLISNGKFYVINNRQDQDLNQYRNKLVLTFKDKKIFTTITESSNNEFFPATIINNNVAMNILKNILKVINFRYKNEHNNNNRVQDSSQTCQRTIYI